MNERKKATSGGNTSFFVVGVLNGIWVKKNYMGNTQKCLKIFLNDSLLVACTFFFLDEKEAKNQGCTCFAKN
jgi:hypothetical protein